MILIFSESNDISTRDVRNLLTNMSQEVLEISRGVPSACFELLSRDKILFHDIEKNKTYNLLDATACWWRRTGLDAESLVKDYPDSISVDGYNMNFLIKGRHDILKQEISSLKRYINDMIYQHCPRHIGNPNYMGLNRLLTLDNASKVGLLIPDYAVITNFSQIDSIDYIGETFVVKTIDNGVYQFLDGKAYYTYTEAMRKEDFRGKDVPLFPSVVMEIIEKKFEIRSFYLDGKFYSMAIFSQNNSQTAVDFRKYSDEKPNKNEPFKLPLEIEIKLDRLFRMHDLNCGSVDLIVDKDGNYVFLEINPVGQFQMTSLPCNYNLEQIIANYLAYGTHEDRIK